jgi:hypothetical protein
VVAGVALFACWHVLGVWERIEAALIAAVDATGRLSWQVSVDWTTSRAHRARRDSADRVAGETRSPHAGSVPRWRSTKTHLDCDASRGCSPSCSLPARPGTHRR